MVAGFITSYERTLLLLFQRGVSEKKINKRIPTV